MINIVQMEVDRRKMEEAAEKMKSMAATVPLEEICEDMRNVLVIGHVACRMIADAMKEGEADE